jgi:60 kDa SS-A/Ro ribonucleoprotein
VKESRVHPIQVIQAMKMMSTKCEDRIDVLAALENVLEMSFKNIEPTSQRFLLALDVSGSMEMSRCIGMKHLTARDAAAAVALSFVKREPYVKTMAFMDKFVPMPLHDQMTYQDIHNYMKGLPFGATDCSLPMQYALDQGILVDCFVVITDNETNTNQRPPHEVLNEYRRKYNPNAKLVVLSTSSTDVSIADPNDLGMLDIAGMDSAVFQVIRTFVNGYS